MKRRVYGAVTAATACVALALTAGVAFAANPHGTPPGQAKQDAASASSTTSSTTTADNSTGVKPSNTTDHDTYAAASSNKTKLYGNGSTAGQVATQAGYGSATLHGPGNSQPHKTLCGPHEVDVHALKAKSNKCGTGTTAGCGTASCSSSTTTTTTTTTSSTATSTTSTSLAATSTTAASTAGTAATAGVTASSVPASGQAPATSGVLGAQATLGSAPANAAPTSGVLGATAPTGSTLPFTGLPLWLPALAGLALLGTGIALRRRAGLQL